MDNNFTESDLQSEDQLMETETSTNRGSKTYAIIFWCIWILGIVAGIILICIGNTYVYYTVENDTGTDMSGVIKIYIGASLIIFSVMMISIFFLLAYFKPYRHQKKVINKNYVSEIQ